RLLLAGRARAGLELLLLEVLLALRAVEPFSRLLAPARPRLLFRRLELGHVGDVTLGVCREPRHAAPSAEADHLPLIRDEELRLRLLLGLDRAHRVDRLAVLLRSEGEDAERDQGRKENLHDLYQLYNETNIH